MPPLMLPALLAEAERFAEIESQHREPKLYSVTDGKAVGTYFEHKFQAYLRQRYAYREGSSAKGVDFPALKVDMKVTSIRQPQSSCPFRDARQKVYGLGYSLLVFVYDKTDDPKSRTGTLRIVHAVFIEASRTADYQTTTGLLAILENDGNEDDLLAFMGERMLPLDDIGATDLAREVMESPPAVGYLTISNALQWRLQYRRVIEKAGDVDGVLKLR